MLSLDQASVNLLPSFPLNRGIRFEISCEVTRLSFVWSRIFRKQRLDCVGSFDPALLLKFINPIGYGFHHFTRGLRGRGSLRRGLLLTRPLVLLDDFYSFLFWHFNQLVYYPIS